MIKISKLADYAVVVLSTLAVGDGRQMTASALSASTGLPEPTVAKVLKLLTRDQILESVRGVNGGYKLIFASSQLSVARIVAAIDGPISVTSCVSETSDVCAYQGRCATRGRWNMVNDAVRGALENITLADMHSAILSKPLSHEMQINFVQGAAV